MFSLIISDSQEEMMPLDRMMRQTDMTVQQKKASLNNQAFDIPFPEIIFCLNPAKEMKLYLKISFGDSK